MVDVNKKGDVWVFVESLGSKVEDTSLELVGKARELADELGVQVGAVVLGSEIAGLDERLICCGGDKVYMCQDPLLAHYQVSSYSKVLCDIANEYNPSIILFGATSVGRDLAPRVAARLGAGLSADCTDLQIGSHKDSVTGKTYDDILLQICPAFGGNVIATIINFDKWPQMATVREGVMKMPELDRNRKGETIKHTVNLSKEDLVVEILDELVTEKTVDLKGSDVVVAGGAGIGSKENFKLLWDLANALGGVVGATRPAVDLGYISEEHMIGATGVTVRPSLYIAAGISGALQHQTGMWDSKKIIAINTDPDAAIFDVAHYKIVGDFNEVIPMMIKAIKAKC